MKKEELLQIGKAAGLTTIIGIILLVILQLYALMSSAGQQAINPLTILGGSLVSFLIMGVVSAILTSKSKKPLVDSFTSLTIACGATQLTFMTLGVLGLSNLQSEELALNQFVMGLSENFILTAMMVAVAGVGAGLFWLVFLKNEKDAKFVKNTIKETFKKRFLLASLLGILVWFGTGYGLVLAEDSGLTGDIFTISASILVLLSAAIIAFMVGLVVSKPEFKPTGRAFLSIIGGWALLGLILVIPSFSIFVFPFLVFGLLVIASLAIGAIALVPISLIPIYTQKTNSLKAGIKSGIWVLKEKFLDALGYLSLLFVILLLINLAVNIAAIPLGFLGFNLAYGLTLSDVLNWIIDLGLTSYSLVLGVVGLKHITKELGEPRIMENR